MSCRATLILVLLLSMGVAVPAFSEEFTFDYQKIIPVDGTPTLDLSLGRGKVTITGSEDNRIIIEAVKHLRAGNYDEAQEVADHIEIRVRQQGKTVTVKTNYLLMPQRGKSFLKKLFGVSTDTYGSVDYVIAVPTTSNIRVNSLSAEITLSSIEGAIDITNETGSIRGEFIFGPVTAKQQSGDIALEWIEGDVRINSVTGKVDINQVRGAIDVITRTSDINIKTELNSPRDFFVRTSSGSVVFSIPESSSGKLNIETEAGRIRTDIPVTINSISAQKVVGEFGRGGPRINISSSTGDVRIAQF